MNEAGSSQNEMLFMRGNAMSGAPIMSGTNQLPKPPIIAGITMKKIMIRPCAVANTLYSCGVGKICRPGFCSSRRMAIDSSAADHAGDQREGQVHRADVLVVRRIDEPAPSGRMVLVGIVGVVVRLRCWPSFLSFNPCRCRRHYILIFIYVT